MSSEVGASYDGDVTPLEAWNALASVPASVLVDVRTRAEWSWVGVPQLAAVAKQPITLEWQVYPSMAENPDFVAVLDAALVKAGFAHDVPIYFLCRSGVRSRKAAIAMTAAGWSRCRNISDGFEGPPDPDGHRGAVAGWKASGLPWNQS
ncbi:rhodanese-like domain-containing protein [Siculibacillus lacustris]|uniref:Rhodanese-like domain-containing protein n=1 Tax=Siculibacillus lacustris TaxID=1549641 RepID=A0A4Q9VXL9_9HYPH|nr:rhodanese-like domain-containing protein [Siculibacillus lacustris]TBW41239.1 rhodanese-like domain-containing protein [Siculibacillus lacustris]